MCLIIYSMRSQQVPARQWLSHCYFILAFAVPGIAWSSTRSGGNFLEFRNGACEQRCQLTGLAVRKLIAADGQSACAPRDEFHRLQFRGSAPDPIADFLQPLFLNVDRSVGAFAYNSPRPVLPVTL